MHLKMKKMNNRCKISNELVKEFSISTPICLIELKCCSIGLHDLKIRNFSNLQINTNQTVKLDQPKHADDDLSGYESAKECLNYFETYFNRSMIPKSPSICWKSICDEGSFSDLVLKSLSTKVPIGQRITYKSLAALAGRSNAQRAVGSVMRKNPIPIIIPCHRVVKTSPQGSNDDIGNYTGGVEIKRWLLDYESRFK